MHLFRALRASHRSTSGITEHLHQVQRCFATHTKRFALQYVQDLPQERAIKVTWTDGQSAKFHKKWLRDHCRCPICLHPTTIQRQVDTASIAMDVQTTSMQIQPESSALAIAWDHDVRQNTCRASEFDAQWLRDHAYSGSFHRPYPLDYRQQRLAHKTLWDQSFQVPSHEYATLMRDGIHSAMKDLHTYGLVMIANTPSNMDATEAFATKIGFVFRTIYGTMWTTNPENEDQEYNDTASTNLELLHHTDGTYMRDPPGLQIFNCVAQAGAGGESRYIDAFHVAEVLRQEDPVAFAFLSTTPVAYHHHDDDAHLATMEPIIRVDHAGNIVQFRHNDYDRAPLTHLSYDQVEEFYGSHAKLMEIMRRASLEKTLKLQVGQMMIVDNQRVMHGRSAFERGSDRALIGCYIGRTEYESRLRVLGII